MKILDNINQTLRDDLSQAVKECRKRGCTCYGAMRKDAVSCFEADYRNKCLIAIGGEMRGLSKGVLQEMDHNIFIPYANDFRNALNASSACTAIGFEIFRQRQTL